MASNACVTVPTQTLYATAVNTIVQDGDPIIVTVTEGLDVFSITSFNPTTSTVTDVEPTATLYATQCPTTTRAAQTSVASSTARTTYERSSTNAGGNVVVQTVVETIVQNGTVIQTRTSTPSPASTAVDNTAGNRESSMKQHTGAIAGGIVGAVLALAAILLCLWCVRKRRRNAQHSRNLDDFFSDPTAAGWEGAGAGAAGSTRRTATMRSRSATVLDLEKERGSAAQDGENHWAALTPLDADEELMNEARPQSRQSLNTLGRPLSFHSMSAGHGLDMAAMHDEDVDPVLLRNDSDRSSKSNLTPGEKSGTSALQSPQSPDFVPAYYGYSSSPPPISPASSPPPQTFSPYGSPPPQEATLYEGFAYDSTGHGGAVQRFNSVSGSLRAGRSSFGSGAGMLSPTSKQRTLSSGGMAQNELIPRPRSAQGLASSAVANDGPTAYSATFAARVMQYHSMQAPSPPQSPPMLAVNSRRGRASLSSGTTAQYPHASHHGSQSPPPGAFPSLHHSTSSGFPPSPYAHLDIHKTAEEREEDAHSALPVVSNEAGLSSSRGRLQRRHQSMSSDILLRVVNPSDREALASDPRHGPSKDARRTLSIRNGD